LIGRPRSTELPRSRAGFIGALAEPAKKAQPWIGWLGKIVLYGLLIATLVGYFPSMMAVFGTGAILVWLAFVAAAFGIGYLAGAGKDHLEPTGGLGTAQRNTAAGVIIAVQNVSDPNVL
jgi:BASS family bile acid:Na+ symporter